MPKVRSGVCRVCGCTEDNCIECIEETGAPCWWVGYPCSRCERVALVKVRQRGTEYIAQSEGMQASSTSGGRGAAEDCARKVLKARRLKVRADAQFSLDPEPGSYDHVVGLVRVKLLEAANG